MKIKGMAAMGLALINFYFHLVINGSNCLWFDHAGKPSAI